MRRMFAQLAAVGVLFSFGFFGSGAFAQEKKVVAVMPFTSPTTYSAMGRNAQEAFITALVKTQKVRVIQATEVGRLLKRYSLHWTGTIDPQFLKAAGKWLKAEYMLAGKLRWGGDAYILSVHVVNVNTLETAMAEDVDFRDESKMRIAVRVMGKKIAGVISGTDSGEDSSSSGSSSSAEMFLNINPRAFYDTSEACINAMESSLSGLSFSGTVHEADESSKTLTVKGYAGGIKEGQPLDVYSASDIGDSTRLTTAYVTKKTTGGFEARYRTVPDEGISLGAKITTEGHKWVVAVGKIDDQVEDNEKLVDRFRSALLEKMSEGDKFQQVEGGATDMLAKLSNRKTRFNAFKELFNRGVELVLEGKFYGSSGSRRAHFTIYSTLTGKVWAEPKFETSL